MKFLTTELDSAPQDWSNDKFYFPIVCDFDLVAPINLSFYKGLDRENCSRCNFMPLAIIHGQIPYKVSSLSSS